MFVSLIQSGISRVLKNSSRTLPSGVFWICREIGAERRTVRGRGGGAPRHYGTKK
jgi:hypothetical protein